MARTIPQALHCRGSASQTSRGEDQSLHRNRRERMRTPAPESPLSKPRWPGGPPICKRANLPSFIDENAAKSFMLSNAPRCSIDLIYRCDSCQHFTSSRMARTRAAIRAAQEGGANDRRRKNRREGQRTGPFDY
jgi:hypothetical protein